MMTILLGLAVTFILFLLIILAFSRKGKGTHADTSQAVTYFSSYDGGHDSLGQQAGDVDGREVSHDGGSSAGGSSDGGWGDSGSGGGGE
jgi:hypothetical protein